MALTDQAIAKIKELISSGEFTAGARLPTERELTHRFGLSRSSLREAVRALALVGVLESRVGDGTYVTTLEPDLLLTGIGFVSDLVEAGSLLEIHRVRRILEPEATRLATPRLTDEDFGRLRDCLHRMETASGVPAFIEADTAFHRVILDGPGYYPDLDRQGGELGQVFWSSPKGGNGNLRVMFLLAIAAASRRILIANAYFVPDQTIVDMLVAARRRGVDVEIIVPGPILDAQVVRRASRLMWGPMLDAGVKIFEYQPTMYHTKVMVVDDIWCSVGSTNFDDRSFRLNQEANLNVYDSAFGAAQAAAFARDRARSREITAEAWRHRSLLERVEERVAGVLRKQL